MLNGLNTCKTLLLRLNIFFGTANKVVDALSMKCLLLQDFRVKTLGFDDLRDIYKDDPNFKEVYEVSENPILRDRGQWI